MMTRAIISAVGLEDRAYRSEEEFLAALAARLQRMIAGDATGLLNLLYRLDVPEEEAMAALATGANAAAALARLIVERQREKLATRAKYTPPPPDEDADLRL